MLKNIEVWIENLLLRQEFSHTLVPYITFLILVVLTGVVIVTGVYFARIFLTTTVGNLANKTKTQWDDFLVKHKLLNALSLIVAVVLLKVAVPFLFQGVPKILDMMEKLVDIYLLYVIILILQAILRATEEVLLSSKVYINKPIASYFQLIRIVLIILGFILALSILLSKSPLYFFGAFGAISAILLLIFKDTILGLVASVQISANDMVRIGDWVEMPKFNADGDVMSINLNTVKIQNWDKTVTTVPTYYFVTEGFKNWRGMRDSGGRRIRRNLRISLSSVKFVDKEMREQFLKMHLIRDYILERQELIEEYNEDNNIDTTMLINGRRLTNIGVFRMYVLKYLEQHPGVHKGMTMMVRHQTPDEFGVPLQVYCFTNSVAWVDYEGTQSDIFDHLFAAAPFFGLEIFQKPTGKDLREVKGL